MKTLAVIIGVLGLTTIWLNWPSYPNNSNNSSNEMIAKKALENPVFNQTFLGEKNIKPKDGLIVPKVFVNGLSSPVGIIPGVNAGFFIAEAGTGNDDGKVTYIDKKGNKTTVIEGFPSAFQEDGNIEGTTHLALHQKQLWIANGLSGKLYRFDLNKFQPGQLPIQADILSQEDIQSFVINYDFENDTDESNIYNLAFDQNNQLYIVDSGANAIIKRSANGELSVFLEIPAIPNPEPAGFEPTVEAVPSGIVFNGQHLLVSTFTGFPFPEGAARIYSVDLNGHILGYKDGFTGLIDIEQSPDDQSLFALELGNFGDFGINFNSGNFMVAGEDSAQPLVQGLNFPNGIAFYNNDEVLVTSYLDGTIARFSIK